jgi:hypothetical protein
MNTTDTLLPTLPDARIFPGNFPTSGSLCRQSTVDGFRDRSLIRAYAAHAARSQEQFQSESSIRLIEWNDALHSTV